MNSIKDYFKNSHNIRLDNNQTLNKWNNHLEKVTN
jgi:hypothetical protein